MYITMSLKDVTNCDFRLIPNNINYVRRQSYACLPKQIPDVHDTLNSIATESNRSEKFSLINDSVNNITVFSTPQNLKFLWTHFRTETLSHFHSGRIFITFMIVMFILPSLLTFHRL